LLVERCGAAPRRSRSRRDTRRTRTDRTDSIERTRPPSRLEVGPRNHSMDKRVGAWTSRAVLMWGRSHYQWRRTRQSIWRRASRRLVAGFLLGVANSPAIDGVRPVSLHYFFFTAIAASQVFHVLINRPALVPATLCPKCRRTGRHLAASSSDAVVDYYRCESCGHVWSIDKSQGTRKDVTVEPHKKTNRSS